MRGGPGTSVCRCVRACESLRLAMTTHACRPGPLSPLSRGRADVRRDVQSNSTHMLAGAPFIVVPKRFLQQLPRYVVRRRLYVHIGVRTQSQTQTHTRTYASTHTHTHTHQRAHHHEEVNSSRSLTQPGILGGKQVQAWFCKVRNRHVRWEA